MTKVEIIVGGIGHEITRSKFTCEELNKIKDYCIKNDYDMESVLTNELGDMTNMNLRLKTLKLKLSPKIIQILVVVQW